MKNIRAYVIVLVFMSSTLTTLANTSHQVSVPISEESLLESGVTVDQVSVALAEYAEMTLEYIHENFISFYSNGQDATGEESGTITIQTAEGPTTWNWKYGSNIMVIWPT